MRKHITIIYFLLMSLLISCSSSLCDKNIDNDQDVHKETKETQVQVNSLIKKSVNPYSENIEQVEGLKIRLKKVLAYTESKNKEPINNKIWEFINNEENSIHNFLKVWKEQGNLNSDLIEIFNKKTNIIFEKMLDFIIQNDKESEIALLKLIDSVQ